MNDHKHKKHNKKKNNRLEDVWGAWTGFIIVTIIMLVLSLAIFNGWQFWMWFAEMGTLIGGVVTTVEYFTKYTKLCPNCKERVPVDAEFCKKCGENIPINCSKCGESVTGRFCEKCGNDNLVSDEITDGNFAQSQKNISENNNDEFPEFCPMCGNGLNSNASFCAVCGAKMSVV